MPDPRFFEDLGPVTLAELVTVTGAELSSPEQGARQVRGVAVLASAHADTVTFLTDKKHAAELAATRAAAVFVSPKDVALVPQGCVPLVTATPQAAYAAAANRLHRPRRHTNGPAV